MTKQSKSAGTVVCLLASFTSLYLGVDVRKNRQPAKCVNNNEQNMNIPSLAGAEG